MLQRLIAKNSKRFKSVASISKSKYLAIKSLFGVKDFSTTTLVFDSSTICTADCIFCAYQFDTRRKTLASFELFRNVIDQYTSNGGEKLNLTPLTGELFTNKDALRMISYAQKKGISYISFFTNCSLLHTIDIDTMLSLNVDRISISVSPLSENIYEKTYRSSQYNRVLHNIRDLLSGLQSSGSTTRISLCFRGPLNLAECIKLPDFVQYVEPYLGPNIALSAMTEFDTWNGKIAESDLLPGMTTTHRKTPVAPILPCSRLNSIYVDPSGIVRLCGCRTNYSGNIPNGLELGSLSDSSLIQLFRSNKASNIRKSFLLGGINDLCSACTWYNL